MAFVEISEVVKRYDQKLSVDHLNLQIEEGEIYGLLGPNGAGKSTTIHMMSGLLSLDQGDILIDGISVKRSPNEVKKRIGLIPQELALYMDVSAAANVAFFARLHGLKGKLLKERVEEALTFVGLQDQAKEKPATFSGGMKRRLNIACAITHRPKLIIMDEPTVGIDPQSRNHILESVRELNKLGSTIVYTSHYMEEVEALCDRVAIMDQGHVIACGTQLDLRERFAAEETITIHAASITPAVIEELRHHPELSSVTAGEGFMKIGVTSSQRCLQDILFICSRHQLSVQSLICEEPNLESLFLNLTGRKLRD